MHGSCWNWISCLRSDIFFKIENLKSMFSNSSTGGALPYILSWLLKNVIFSFFPLYKAQLKQSSLTIKHHSTQNPPKDSNCFLDQSCDCYSQMVSFTFNLLSVSNWKCQPYLLNVTNSIFTAPKNLPLGKLWDKFLFPSLPHFLLSQSLTVHPNCQSLITRRSPGIPASWYSHSFVTRCLTSYQNWSMWPMYGRSDTSLLRFG